MLTKTCLRYSERNKTLMQPGSLHYSGHFCLSTTTVTKDPRAFQCLSHPLYCRWPSADSEAMAKPLLRDTTELTVISKHTAPPHITTLPPHSSSSETPPVHFCSVLKDDIKHILNCCNHSCLKCLYFSVKSFGIVCSFYQEKGVIYICWQFGFYSTFMGFFFNYYISDRTCWTSLWWMCLPNQKAITNSTIVNGTLHVHFD